MIWLISLTCAAATYFIASKLIEKIFRIWTFTTKNYIFSLLFSVLSTVVFMRVAGPLLSTRYFQTSAELCVANTVGEQIVSHFASRLGWDKLAAEGGSFGGQNQCKEACSHHWEALLVSVKTLSTEAGGARFSCSAVLESSAFDLDNTGKRYDGGSLNYPVSYNVERLQTGSSMVAVKNIESAGKPSLD